MLDEHGIEEELRRFAEARLHAALFDDCVHRFSLVRCPSCSGLALEVAIERHPGDEPGDFMGVLRVTCSACGARQAAMGVTDPDRPAVTQEERPVCTCGGRVFHVGICERWEVWGFFDAGTVVACCSACGKHRVLVDTD